MRIATMIRIMKNTIKMTAMVMFRSMVDGLERVPSAGAKI